MHFRYAPDIDRAFPGLATGLLYAEGIDAARVAPAELADATEPLVARARARLHETPEGEMPEIQAWRRAFAAMGYKPTGTRCAAESLLRRVRKDGRLPSISPLVDVCNAASLAHAIPVAAFDPDRIDAWLEVREAKGSEVYLAFSGEEEAPAAGEIVFADAAGRAHARRWTHRQSAWSAVRPDTRRALLVCEALHETAAQDVARLVDELREGLERLFGVAPHTALLDARRRSFALPDGAP